MKFIKILKWNENMVEKLIVKSAFDPTYSNAVVLPKNNIAGFVVNYGISNTVVLEIPWFTTKPVK